MIKVYFEYKGVSELVASFKSEELYLKCLRSLINEAKKSNSVLTESKENEKV